METKFRIYGIFSGENLASYYSVIAKTQTCDLLDRMTIAIGK